MKATSDAPTTSRRLVVAGAFALVALVALALIFWATRRSERDAQRARAPSAPSAASVRASSPPPGAKPSGASVATDPTPVRAASPPPEVRFHAAWGTRDDQLGRERLAEGNALGPTSVAADVGGDVYVLDPVNGRLVRRGVDGKVRSTLAVDLRAPEDLAVAADGSMAVLDRHADRQVALYDANGRLNGKLAVTGEHLPDPGEVTGVFVDGDDVYLERRHERLVHVGTTKGKAAEPRTELAGRPSRDGELLLTAAILDAKAGRVVVTAVERASGQPRFRRELALWPFVRAILLLETDGAGVVYFAAEVQRGTATPTVVLSCLEPITGTVIGGAVLPANTLPEESLRDLAVLDQGGVVHALRSEEGVTYTTHQCG